MPASKKIFKWFSRKQSTLYFAIGGDGAAVGQADEEMTLWCISLLNLGRHVGSADDNFLLVAAMSAEDHPILLSYAHQLVIEVEQVKDKQFTIIGMFCTFEYKLLPVGMKWLAKYAGELGNSTRYFTSFGNVCTSDNGEKGVLTRPTAIGPQGYWQPWSWEHRVETAQKVAAFKSSLRGNLEGSTNRTKVLNYMADVLHTLQEVFPSLGQRVQLASPDRLHHMNNTWQLVFELVLCETVLRSNLPWSVKTTTFKADSPIQQLLNVLKVNMLLLKVKQWLDDDRSDTAIRRYFRFRGRESRACRHHLHALVKPLL